MDTTSDGIEPGNFEVPLEAKMESLEIKELNEGPSCSTSTANSSESPKKRSLRKRVPQVIKTEGGKRRVIIKPKKRLNTGSNNTTEDISQIYLCKKIKRLAPNLETIFEEPKVSKANEVVYTELRKKKRFLVFDQNNQGKIKKRQQKVKKLFGKPVFKKKRSSMDLLLQKLCDVE